jgi:mRNA-degrading endonuclease RelE of RelBE toxin-antitoxin system
MKKVNGTSRDKFLDVVGGIAREPLVVKGNLVKPLSKDKKGLWRYRLGKNRILYHPDIATKTILFLDFSDRSKIYRH